MLQNLKVSFLIWKNTCSHLPAGDNAAELNIFRTQFKCGTQRNTHLRFLGACLTKYSTCNESI